MYKEVDSKILNIKIKIYNNFFMINPKWLNRKLDK